jgi:hypothetical protein
MGTTPAENNEPNLLIPPAMVAAAVEAAAQSPLGDTEMLGFFEGLTSKGFRLVWEDGALVLVAYSADELDPILVDHIKQRLRWLEINRALVQDRVRAVVGPDASMSDCNIRVVVRETDTSDEAILATLAARVELISFEFTSSDDAIALRPRRKVLRSPRASQSKAATPRGVEAKAHSSSEAISTVDRYLLELRRAANDAGRRDRCIDTADWRCSPTMNLVRTYGLLVTIAALFTVPTSLRKKASSTSRVTSTTTTGAESLVAKVLEFLGLFADAVAREQFHAKALATVLAEVTALVDEQLQDRVHGSQGAYLGPAWRSPVPPQIGSLISCMGGSTTVAERANALAAAEGVTAKLLEETNCSIASSVHIAQTLDDRAWPDAPVDGDQRYLQGALLRILSGHRLLLELVGVKSRTARLAMLGLAEKIALQTTFAAFWTAITDADQQSQDYLNTVRRGAIAVLSGPACVSGASGHTSVLRDIVKHQKETVLSAMKVASRIGFG